MVESPSVTRFREFLCIKTVHPKPDYAASTLFLQKQAQELGLEFKLLELVQGKPIVIMKWTGSNPQLPALLLNSHVDVVPVSQVK